MSKQFYSGNVDIGITLNIYLGSHKLNGNNY